MDRSFKWSRAGVCTPLHSEQIGPSSLRYPLYLRLLLQSQDIIQTNSLIANLVFHARLWKNEERSKRVPMANLAHAGRVAARTKHNTLKEERRIILLRESRVVRHHQHKSRSFWGAAHHFSCLVTRGNFFHNFRTSIKSSFHHQVMVFLVSHQQSACTYNGNSFTMKLNQSPFNVDILACAAVCGQPFLKCGPCQKVYLPCWHREVSLSGYAPE